MTPKCSFSRLTLAGILQFALLILSAVPPALAANKTPPSAWAIQVEPVQAKEGRLPPDFSMAVYENLIVQLARTDKFQHVFRSGDHQADTARNLLVLRLTLVNFEHGNQTERAVTTVKGATKIQVHLKVSQRDGPVVVEKDVQGTVRFFGENLKATDALAKSIATTLRDSSLPDTTKVTGQ